MNGRHRRVKRLLFHAAVRASMVLARALPRPAALRTFAAIGAATGRIDRPAVRRAMEHLEIAFGPTLDEEARRSIVRAMYRDLGRNVVDVLRMETTPVDRLREIVEFDGLEHLDAALARGRGVLALSAHLGNWEILGAALCARGYPLHVLARPLFDRRSDAMLASWRRTAGLVVHVRENGLLGIARALRAGEMVGVLMDQDTRGPGIFVEFFGRAAHTPTTPFALARRLDAAIVPILIGLDADGVHRVRVHPPIERVTADERAGDPLREDLIAWHRLLEREIRSRPTQWPWFHRRWRKRPVGEAGVSAPDRPHFQARNHDPVPSRPVAISR